MATPPGLVLGGMVGSYGYREPAPGVRETGARWGLVAGWVQPVPGGSGWLRGGLEVATGRLRYQGSGTLDGVPDTRLEGRGVAGQDFLAAPDLVLAPYLGLGQRQVWDDLRGTTSSGARGYRRETRLVYLPAGGTARMELGGGWTGSFTAEYDWVLSARATSRLGDAGTGLDTALTRPGGGHGFRLELNLGRGQLAFGPWLQGWDMQASDTVPVGQNTFAQEPANRTREGGLLVTWRFGIL